MNFKKVIIAGAGPGDPELITVKAAKYLGLADVIITDRLVSEVILHRYTHPGASIIFAGKEGYRQGSADQKSINELLVNYYYEGKLVVRLKGGDVAFYSNVLDELQALKAQDIPYEIIPGITAASGAAAYAGIPLTARGYADSVRFLTHFHDRHYTESYWKELAATDDTLVYYMSGNKFKTVAIQLIKHHISKDKVIAVIEQATTPFQKVVLHQFDDISTLCGSFVSPTLIIVGKVVNLHESFRWEMESRLTGDYFRPMVRKSRLQEIPLSI